MNQKICNFFNSGKHCPYDEGGCKFAHKVSEYSEKVDGKVDIDIETTDKSINDELNDALDKNKGFEVNKKEMEDRIKLYSATIKKLRISQVKCWIRISAQVQGRSRHSIGGQTPPFECASYNFVFLLCYNVDCFIIIIILS